MKIEFTEEEAQEIRSAFPVTGDPAPKCTSMMRKGNGQIELSFPESVEAPTMYYVTLRRLHMGNDLPPLIVSLVETNLSFPEFEAECARMFLSCGEL